MPSASETISINGHQISFGRIVGEVLHADRSFETRVEGSGGGGWVGPNGGYIGETKVSSHASQHQKVFIRTDSGSEESFDFKNWNLSVRPGSRVALITCPDPNTGTLSVMATRNLDTGEESWQDVRSWAQRRGLLGGGMRVWPSGVVALALGGAFTLFASYARMRSGTTPYNASDFLLVIGIVFVPAVIIEWFIAIALGVGDAEPRRIQELLTGFLRTGQMTR